MGPTQINKLKKTRIRRREEEADNIGEGKFIFLFFLLSLLFSILWKSDSQNSSGQEAKCFTQ